MGLMLELKRDTILTENGVQNITTINSMGKNVFFTQAEQGKEVSTIKDLVFQGIFCGIGQFFDKENQYTFNGWELYTKVFNTPDSLDIQQLVTKLLNEDGVVLVYLDFDRDWANIMREFYQYLKKEYEGE